MESSVPPWIVDYFMEFWSTSNHQQPYLNLPRHNGGYLIKKQNPLLDQQEFHRRDQMPGESIDRYYAAFKCTEDAIVMPLLYYALHSIRSRFGNCHLPFPLTKNPQDIRINGIDWFVNIGKSLWDWHRSKEFQVDRLVLTIYPATSGNNGSSPSSSCCGNYGRISHTRNSCPVYNKQYNSCGKNGHYANVCHSRKKGGNPNSTTSNQMVRWYWSGNLQALEQLNIPDSLIRSDKVVVMAADGLSLGSVHYKLLFS